MKFSDVPKISFALGTFGVFIMIFCTVRYYWLYYDPSQLILSDLIGAVFVYIAYDYAWKRQVDRQIHNHYQRLEAVAAKLFNIPMEHLDNEIKQGIQ